jgi:hypothetical protein
MYEEYAVANRIELGKTYRWSKCANYTGEPLIASEGRDNEWVFNSISKPLVTLVVFKSDIDKLIFGSKF